jgi:hypothetical protein
MAEDVTFREVLDALPPKERAEMQDLVFRIFGSQPLTRERLQEYKTKALKGYQDRQKPS